MLDHKSVLYNEILLKPTEVHLNEGFIFHHESIVEFLGDSSINT